MRQRLPTPSAAKADRKCPRGNLMDAVFDESSEDRQGSVPAFDRCHSRQKRCRIDDLKQSVLVGFVLRRKNVIFPNGEFLMSICDQNRAPKKTQAKRICSATLHVAVFDENSTD